MTVWDDDYEAGGDDLIDQFNIENLNSVFVCNQSNPLTIKGMNGTGKLTLAFYNLVTNPTSCIAENNPTFSTKSLVPAGNLEDIVQLRHYMIKNHTNTH